MSLYQFIVIMIPPDKLGVESEGHEGFRQLPHVELHHICNYIGMNIRQVNELCTDVLKRLTKLFNLAFHPGHPVDALDRRPSAIHNGHTSLDQGRDFSSDFKKVMTKINPKGGHLPQQALGPTEQVKGFQALLVRGEPTIRALVTLPIDVAVALSALGRLLNLSELV